MSDEKSTLTKSCGLPDFNEFASGLVFWKYAWTRLRFFLLVKSVQIIEYLVEWVLIYAFLPYRDFLLAGLAFAVFAFMRGAVWGGLEGLREEVRKLAQNKERYKIPKEVGRWLYVSKKGAWIVGALAALCLLPGSYLLLYIAVRCLLLSADLVLKTLYSGVFALRRVARPTILNVCVQLIPVAIVFLFWKQLERWSFPLAVLAYGVSQRLVLLLSLKKSYLQMGIGGIRQVKTSISSLNISFKAALSYGLFKLEPLFTFALFVLGSSQEERWRVFVLYAWILPFMQLSTSWVDLFYFDIKKAKGAIAQARLRSLGIAIGFLLPLISWGLSVAALELFYDGHRSALIFPLGLFFLTRSIFLFFAARAFSVSRFSELSFSMVAAGVVSFFLVNAVPELSVKLALYAMSLWGWVFYLKEQKADEKDFWLFAKELQEHLGNAHLKVFSLREDLTPWQKKRAMCAISTSYNGRVASIGAEKMLALVGGDEKNDATLLASLGGVVGLRAEKKGSSGKSTLEAVLPFSVKKASLENLDLEFRSLFGQAGRMINCQRPKLGDKLLGQEQKDVARLTMKYLEDPLHVKRGVSGLKVAPLIEGDKIAKIYVIKMSKENRFKAQEFVKKITASNLGI